MTNASLAYIYENDSMLYGGINDNKNVIFGWTTPLRRQKQARLAMQGIT